MKRWRMTGRTMAEAADRCIFGVRVRYALVGPGFGHRPTHLVQLDSENRVVDLRLTRGGRRGANVEDPIGEIRAGKYMGRAILRQFFWRDRVAIAERDLGGETVADLAAARKRGEDIGAIIESVVTRWVRQGYAPWITPRDLRATALRMASDVLDPEIS